MTLQSMVFEPANRVLYLAVGTEATTQPYHRLDLGPYFVSVARGGTSRGDARRDGG
jgi:hypothetical protein